MHNRQQTLFNEDKHFELENGRLDLWQEPFVYDDNTFEKLRDQLAWREDSMTILGTEIAVPRLNVMYGDKGLNYTYSNVRFTTLPWTKELLDLKRKVEDFCECSFNSVLCNYYRDGRDSVAWHSDDEPELGEDPTIASLSFGSTRKFQLKHKFKNMLALNLELGDGALLLMSGAVQKNYLHQVPKSKRCHTGRINLTFRTIQ